MSAVDHSLVQILLDQLTQQVGATLHEAEDVLRGLVSHLAAAMQIHAQKPVGAALPAGGLPDAFGQILGLGK